MLTDVSLPWRVFQSRYPHISHDGWKRQRALLRTPPATPPPTLSSTAPSPLYAAYATYHQAVRDQFLPPREFDVTLTTSSPIAVTFLADLHIGGEGVNITQMRHDLEQIAATPHCYLALGGDLIDNFILRSMSHAAQDSDATVKVQWELARELLAIVKDSVLFVGSGNHDQWSIEQAQIDGLAQLIMSWHTVYTREGGLIRLHLGDQLYRIFRKHTPSRGRQRRHPTNAVVEELFTGAYDYDVGVLEHEHVPALLQFRHRQVDRIAIRCGTYKQRDVYAETRGFQEAAIASPTVVFYPDTRCMVPFLYLHQALQAFPSLCQTKPIPTQRRPATTPVPIPIKGEAPPRSGPNHSIGTISRPAPLPRRRAVP